MSFDPRAPAAPPPAGYPTRRSPRAKAVAASDRRLRTRLSEGFVRNLVADWEQHGVQAIRQLREEHLPDYVRTVVSILPKHVHVDVPADAPLVVFDFRGRLTAATDPLAPDPDEDALQGDEDDDEDDDALEGDYALEAHEEAPQAAPEPPADDEPDNPW